MGMNVGQNPFLFQQVQQQQQLGTINSPAISQTLSVPTYLTFTGSIFSDNARADADITQQNPAEQVLTNPETVDTTDFFNNNASILDFLPTSDSVSSFSVQKFTPTDVAQQATGSNNPIYGVSYSNNGDASGQVTEFFMMTASGPVHLARQSADGDATILQVLDNDQNVTQEIRTESDGSKVVTNYDNQDHATESIQISRDGIQTTTRFDATGNTTEIEEKRGNQITTFDPATGKPTNKVTITTINGQEYKTEGSYEYNADGSYSVTITNDELHPGVATRQTFDANGNLEQTTTVTTTTVDGQTFRKFETVQNNPDGTYTVKTEDTQNPNIKSIVQNFNAEGMLDSQTITFNQPLDGGGTLNRSRTTDHSGAITSTSTTYTDQNGNSFEVKYDSDGNIETTPITGESFRDTAKRLGLKRGTPEYNEFARLNPEAAGRGYFQTGVAGSVKVPAGFENKINMAELNVDPKVQGEAFARQAIANADITAYENNTENTRVKPGDSWYNIAKQNLIDCGNAEPTPAEISTRSAELQKLNGTSKLTAGQNVKVMKTDATKATEATRAAEQAQQADAAQQAQMTAEAKAVASDIYNSLMGAKHWYGDNEDAMRAALTRINGQNPKVIAELNELLKNDYKAENGLTSLERFLKKELDDDELQSYTQKWINNGALTGEEAIEAQARMAFREITAACDGAGTDVNQLYAGTRMIKSPTNVPEPLRSQNAQAVYAHVNQLISQHRGGQWANFETYVKGDIWNSEKTDLLNTLAVNGALAGTENVDAITNQVLQAVDGWGTDIGRLDEALSAIDSPEEMATVNTALRAKYGDTVKPLPGQTYLEAVLYAECDKWYGTRDYNEIRGFADKLISQGAFTPQEAVQLRARINIDQIKNGEYEDAFKGIVDAETYEATAAAFGGDLDAFLSNTKGKSQESIDLLNADLASRGVLTDNNKVADLATRLITSDDFHSRAMGFMAINQNIDVARLIDGQLTQKGTSLAAEVQEFQSDREGWARAGNIVNKIGNVVSWVDPTGILLGAACEFASDKMLADTNVSNNLYLVTDHQVVDVSEEQQIAYAQTLSFMKAELQQLKANYQATLDGQGLLSAGINYGFEIKGIGTTQEEIDRLIEKQEAAIRDLEAAATGRCVDASGNPVSFETVYQSYTNTEFNISMAESVNTQGQQLALMQHANEEIPATWDVLNRAINSDDAESLTGAILSAKNTLTRFTGAELPFQEGFSLSPDGKILGADGQPLSVDELRTMATAFQEGVAGVVNAIYGFDPNDPDNSIDLSDGNIADIMEDAYENKEKQFKKDFKAFYNREPAEDTLESYNTTIETGKAVFNGVVIIGATLLAPVSGGASLGAYLGVGATVGGAVVTGLTVGATSYAVNTLESGTDAHGLGHLENSNNGSTAAWSGVGATFGAGASGLAGQVVTKGFSGASSFTQGAARLGVTTGADFQFQNASTLIQNNGDISLSDLGNNAIRALGGGLGGRAGGKIGGRINIGKEGSKFGAKIGSDLAPQFGGTAIPALTGDVQIGGLPLNMQNDLSAIAANIMNNPEIQTIGQAKQEMLNQIDALPDGETKQWLIESCGQDNTRVNDVFMGMKRFYFPNM